METENETCIDWHIYGLYGYDEVDIWAFYTTREFRLLLSDIGF